MHRILVLACSSLLALAACEGGGGGGPAPGVGGGELTAFLVVPDPSLPADPSTAVVVEFNRLMDPAPFQDREAASLWFKRGELPWTELDLRREAEEDVALGRSRLRFSTDALLPASAGLKVVLTARVRDRQGNPLSPRELEFATADPAGSLLFLEERFLDGSMADPEAGGLDWAAAGPGLRPGRLGGPGVLGEFVAPPGTTVVRTEESAWPAAQTLIGQEIRVSNGLFFFQRLEVPADSTLRFAGSYPARLFVAGDLVVHGKILADGEEAAPTEGGQSTPRGGEGGHGGPGGGRGGPGGGQPLFSRVQGFAGAGLAVPPGHPDGHLAAACGGRGAPGHPASGLSQDLLFGGDDRCRMAAAGGGGGSAFALGQAGSVLQAPEPFAANTGAPGLPGEAFPFLPLRPGLPGEVQFLLGGAGGGGGGAHPFLHLRDPFGLVAWHAAGGGGGGGGALQVRAGGRILVGAGGLLSARGGGGSDRNTLFSSPGGGGSGGSVLLQAGDALLLAGTLDVRGGPGGRLVDAAEGLEVAGGRGSHGFCRVESDPRLALGALGTIEPAPGEEASGLLEERDPVTSGRSRVYRARALSPRYVRFELDVQEGLLRRLYSDDPALGVVPAWGATPVGIAFQGVRLDREGRVLSYLPWCGALSALTVPGQPAPDALRFAIWLDTGQNPGLQPFEVHSLRIYYRP